MKNPKVNFHTNEMPFKTLRVGSGSDIHDSEVAVKTTMIARVKASSNLSARPAV